jgi:endonuclease/exonuclease/phosphatase family metal-dependent hydrolase
MRIQVATFNVWALPEPFARAVLPRMTAIGERLAEMSADVVAFQEVWTEGARDILLLAGTRAGYVHHWFIEDAIGGSGLMVLSRLPILESHFEPFALSGYPEQLDNGEFLSGKGFAYLRLLGPDGPFTFLNTHLHARYRKRASHQFAPHRIGQIIQLAARARQHSEPVLMVGDFNFGDHRPEYHVLTGLTGMRDTAVELDNLRSTVLRANPYRTKKTKKTKRFASFQELGKRVDYVFVRDGSKAAFRPLSLDRVFDEPIELEGRPGAYSNHAGLLAEVEAFPAQIASSTLLNRQAVDLASKLLSEGRQEAERRRSDGRALAGMGMACAVAAAAGGRTESVSRRRFLQKSLRVAAVAGLAPGIGYSVMSELVVPNELIAFDRAEESLGQLALQHFAGDAERTS